MEASSSDVEILPSRPSARPIERSFAEDFYASAHGGAGFHSGEAWDAAEGARAGASGSGSGSGGGGGKGKRVEIELSDDDIEEQQFELNDGPTNGHKPPSVILTPLRSLS